jgi:hypothetical protein
MFKRLAIFTILCAVLFPVSAFAQFNGQIDVALRDMENKEEKAIVSLILTPERIMAAVHDADNDGLDIKPMGLEGATNVLIRLKEEDFVVMIDESDMAFSLPKKQIEGFVNMAAMMAQQQGNQQKYPTVNYSYTGKKENILGFSAVEIKLESEEEPGNYATVWVTDEVPVYWGMLAGKWNFMGAFAQINSMDWLKNGQLPLLVNIYENNELKSQLEIINVDERTVDPSEVNVPEGVSIMSMQDMNLNNFRNGRN